jgi:hypothetical protein
VTVTVHDPESVLAAIEGSDRFLVQQVFRPVANEYRISIPAPGGTTPSASASRFDHQKAGSAWVDLNL